MEFDFEEAEFLFSFLEFLVAETTANMYFEALYAKLTASMTSDHASVVSMNLFVALLCACIIIGHLLEENRWINESITALVIVSLSL